MPFQNTTLPQLTAPGVTAYSKVQPGSIGEYGYKVVIASINTSLVLRVEYNNASTGSAISRSEDIAITANGTYIIPIFASEAFSRLNFVSEVGGTAVTVDAIFQRLY